MSTQEKRVREFFLTINKGAECFDTIKVLLTESDTSFYAMINHNRDKKDDNEPKPEHLHLILKYGNNRTMSAVMKEFSGAHVEVAGNLGKCAKYLLHKTPKSLVDGKVLYSADEVITNNQEYFSTLVKSADLELFDPNAIETYFNDGTIGLLAYYRRFGAQVNGYTKLIGQIEDSLTSESKAIEGEAKMLKVAEILAEQNIDDDGNLPF